MTNIPIYDKSTNTYQIYDSWSSWTSNPVTWGPTNMTFTAPDITYTTSATYSTSGTFYTWGGPQDELDLIHTKEEKEQRLREKYSSLQELWDEYQLVLKLFEDNEIDKSFKERYGDFNEKEIE